MAPRVVFKGEALRGHGRGVELCVCGEACASGVIGDADFCIEGDGGGWEGFGIDVDIKEGGGGDPRGVSHVEVAVATGGEVARGYGGSVFVEEVVAQGSR